MRYEVDSKEKWSVLNALVGIVLQWRRGCIVEIGSSYGDAVREKRKSTTINGDHAKLFDVNFYTCDIRRQVVIDYEKHLHFAMSSFLFMEQYDEVICETPAVVFLDGCHDSPVVIEEVKFFFPRLIIGGMIFLHDTMPRKEKALNRSLCSDSYLVRQELETWTEKADCLTVPWSAGNNGLTMIIKKEEIRPYYRR